MKDSPAALERPRPARLIELWSSSNRYTQEHSQTLMTATSSNGNTHSPSSTTIISNSSFSIGDSSSNTGSIYTRTSAISTISSATNNEPTLSTTFISTTIVSSLPSTITSLSTTYTSYVPTTITTSSDVVVSQTAAGSSGSLASAGQTVCLGDGLDVSAVGLLSTVIFSSVLGLIIWVIFAFLRPRFRQVYSVREWFPPQEFRPRPLSDSLWAFLFPHAPLVPTLPKKSELANESANPKLPSDGQLSQRVLWTCFLIVLAWSLIGLAGVLPLYLVDTPCLADSASQASFGGVYSTLQDLSLSRLLELLEDRNITTSRRVSSRAIVDGTNVTSRIKTRLIILTVFVIVLEMLPAVVKLLHEFTKLANFRKHWLEVQCEGLEMGWLSAKRAPGFVGWGEKRLKDFIMKVGLSSSLDRNGGLSASGNMTGIGSGQRSRSMSWRNRDRDDQPIIGQEKETLEIDIRSLFSVGDTGVLPSLIQERDRILEQLEVAEARYIASFRLTTPEPSEAELPILPPEETSSKLNISRPKALAAYARARSRRGRQKTSSSSAAPTSYVAPSQYYRLRNVRGLSTGHVSSHSGGGSNPEEPSFSDSVRSRIVGSRFQEFHSEQDEEPLPIGSRVTFTHGGRSSVTQPMYGPNCEEDPSSGNATEGSRGVSQMQDEHSSTRPLRPEYSGHHRDTFPIRSGATELQREGQVPLHLRLQTQGPFVRPRSGISHDFLGSVYSDIRNWRTRLKQINAEISQVQNDCYNDIADGVRIKGWLLTGRSLRFLPGVELIEGRSKDDILWDVLQQEERLGKQIAFWCSVVMIAVTLGAGLVAVSGLVVATAPDVAHYLRFFRPILEDDDKVGPGITTTLVPAILATIFFFLAIAFVRAVSKYSGNISATAAKLVAYKASFFILCVVGVLWFCTAGALVFSLDAFATSSQHPRSVANGSIYMTVFFLALVVNMTIIAPGVLLLQPFRLKRVILLERRATTPRQRFRALYPASYDATYATACCILAVVLASAFSLIFPLVGPAVVLLLLLTIIAHRFLVGYVYGRTDPQTGGLLQLWLLKRFATAVCFQPILLGLILMTRRLFTEGGILVGVGGAIIVAVEVYCFWRTKRPGRKSLSTLTLAALERFEQSAREKHHRATESEGVSLASGHRSRSRGSMASVLEMMSLTLAVMPAPHQSRGAVPLETESLDDRVATDRAARTHPDAPPRLSPLPFSDHAEEMAGILYAPELLAPSPTIWLPNDPAGIARSEAYDLSRYHGLRAVIDVRSYDDVTDHGRSSSHPP